MIRTSLLFTATFLTSLSAGIFYAYACSVNPGLHRLPDTAYLSAMQEINRAIQNPAFFICFMGPVILLPISAWMHYDPKARTAFWCLLAATMLYVLGVFGVTIFGNVPLNEALDKFNLAGASPEQQAAQRAAFEAPWGSWHWVRTVAAVVAALGLAAVFSRTVKLST